MSKLKYLRKSKTIHTISSGENQVFESINKAKAESRRLQMAEDDALGRGSLQLTEALPRSDKSLPHPSCPD